MILSRKPEFSLEIRGQIYDVKVTGNLRTLSNDIVITRSGYSEFNSIHIPFDEIENFSNILYQIQAFARLGWQDLDEQRQKEASRPR